MKQMSALLRAGALLLVSWSTFALAQSAPNPEGPLLPDAQPPVPPQSQSPSQPQTGASEPSAPVADTEPPPPPPANFQNPIPSAQLAFLTGFDGRPAKELMKDKRFKELR